MVSKGMVSNSKYWISKKIRAYQYPFAHIILSVFFKVSTHIFKFMLCKGMVSKSKYWISEKNKGDEYSKKPKTP